MDVLDSFLSSSTFKFSEDLSIGVSSTFWLIINVSCTKSKVSVSANKLEFKSYSWTLSKFWNKNLASNKNSVALSLVN